MTSISQNITTKLRFWDRRRPRNRDREDGVTYQHSLSNRYTAPEVTAAKIRDMEDNAYFVKLEQNQRNLIFCEKIEIVVKDPKSEIDTELSDHITTMCNAEKVRLNQKLIMIWSSVWRYGAAFVNDVWGWRGSEYRLLGIRILPSWTFADLPQNQEEYIAYGDILRGVVLNKDGNVEYWQKQSTTDNPVLLTNVTMITDPTEHALAGTPLCLPAVHIIDMLGYCHSGQMKKINRVAAPSLFPRITEEKQRPAGMGSDATYLKKVLQNWGINTGFALRENMEFADPHLPQESCALDTIRHYEGILDRMYSPTSLITKDGTLIGGSNLGELELMKMYISSVHRWLEEEAESMLQHYLDVNGFTDYTVEITIPSFEVDETPINIQRVEAMKPTQTAPALATLDEMREILGLDPATDEIRAELELLKPAKPEPPNDTPPDTEDEEEDEKELPEEMQRKNTVAGPDKIAESEAPLETSNDPSGSADIADWYESELLAIIDQYENDVKKAIPDEYKDRKVGPPVPIDTDSLMKLLKLAGDNAQEAAFKVIEDRTKEGYLRGVKFATERSTPYGIKIAFKLPYDKTVIETLQGRNVAAFKGLTDDMSKDIMRQVTDGALNGETRKQISKRIEATCNDIGRVRSKTIARTELMKGVNEGTRRRYDSAGIEQLRRVEAYDERTCKYHRIEINGRTYHGCQPYTMGGIGNAIFTIEEAAMVDQQAHPNCRGTWVPFIEGLSKIPGEEEIRGRGN